MGENLTHLVLPLKIIHECDISASKGRHRNRKSKVNLGIIFMLHSLAPYLCSEGAQIMFSKEFNFCNCAALSGCPLLYVFIILSLWSIVRHCLMYAYEIMILVHF